AGGTLRVLGVGDDQVRLMSGDETGHERADGEHAGLSHHVTHEEDDHVVAKSGGRARPRKTSFSVTTRSTSTSSSLVGRSSTICSAKASPTRRLELLPAFKVAS